MTLPTVGEGSLLTLRKDEKLVDVSGIGNIHSPLLPLPFSLVPFELQGKLLLAIFQFYF